MEVDPPASSTLDSSPPSLSPADRARRDRECVALLKKYEGSPELLLHTAMKVHERLGNKSAAAIHKKLMKDPNSMDGFCKPPEPVRKVTLLQALDLVTHQLSVATYKELKIISDECGAKWLPCYTDVNKGKEILRPPSDALFVTETGKKNNISRRPSIRQCSRSVADYETV